MADQDLPGYAPERPLWQPPAVIPSGSVGELARAVQTALAGISGALQQLGGRRNVVPLQGNLDARDGQVIAGVASGQVITLPSPNLGQYGSITVILTAVSSAASVVSPDGSSYTLDQTGVYEFAISPDDTAWRAPPWLSSGGSAAGAEVVLGAAHASFPAGRLAADSTEVDADLTVANVISWALKTASVAFGKLADLTAFSVLGRAGSSSGVMAAISAGTAGHHLLRNGSTDIRFASPAGADMDLATDGKLSLKAFTGEVTKSAAAVALTVTRSTNFTTAPWTGDHDFQGVVKVDELFVDEQGSSPSVAAGQGLLWVEDRAPNQLVFTDDENADWRLNNSCPEKLTAVQTATNTTNAITCVSFSIPANTLRDNTLYEIDGYLVATRGATATACDLTVDLVLDGTVYATFTVAMFTSEASRHLHVKGHLRCTATGATGRFLANIWGDGNITTADPAPGSTNTTSSGATTKDTTAALTVLFRANMSAAVSNLSIRWISGSVVRVD